MPAVYPVRAVNPVRTTGWASVSPWFDVVINTPSVTVLAMSTLYVGTVMLKLPRYGARENETRWISLLSVDPVSVVATLTVMAVPRSVHVGS